MNIDSLFLKIRGQELLGIRYCGTAFRTIFSIKELNEFQLQAELPTSRVSQYDCYVLTDNSHHAFGRKHTALASMLPSVAKVEDAG